MSAEKNTCRTCRWVGYLPTRPGMMQNLKCGLPEGFLMDSQVPHEGWGCTDWEVTPGGEDQLRTDAQSNSEDGVD